MIKPIEQIDHKNIVDEIGRLGYFIELEINRILEKDETKKESDCIKKAENIKIKIDCLKNTALKLDLRKVYVEAYNIHEELKKI